MNGKRAKRSVWKEWLIHKLDGFTKEDMQMKENEPSLYKKNKVFPQSFHAEVTLPTNKLDSYSMQKICYNLFEKLIEQNFVYIERFIDPLSDDPDKPNYRMRITVLAIDANKYPNINNYTK